MNPPRKLLSASEWRVFYLLSKKGPLKIRDLMDEMERQDPARLVAYTTVLTLAQRLVGKGYITQQPAASARGTLIYTAQVPYEVALRLHVEHFLAETTFYAPADLQAIREMIDRHLSG
jgi:predicted transcriptional regulator